MGIKLLHLTQKKLINSILTHGILPSYIEHSEHWKSFKKELKDRRCIYFWSGETYNNTKYVKDMVYAKMYIHPMNKLFKSLSSDAAKYFGIKTIETGEEEEHIDFSRMGNRLFGGDDIYLLLEVDSENIELLSRDFIHTQFSTDEKSSTTCMMDDKYAHDDKSLFIAKSTIRPEFIKVVETISVRKYSDDSLGFTFGKSKHYLSSSM